MEQQDPISSIYNDLKLKDQGIDLKTFKSKFETTPELRKSVYNDLGLKDSGIDFDTYETKLGFSKKKDQTEPLPADSSQPPTGQNLDGGLQTTQPTSGLGSSQDLSDTEITSIKDFILNAPKANEFDVEFANPVQTITKGKGLIKQQYTPTKGDEFIEKIQIRTSEIEDGKVKFESLMDEKIAAIPEIYDGKTFDELPQEELNTYLYREYLKETNPDKLKRLDERINYKPQMPYGWDMLSQEEREKYQVEFYDEALKVKQAYLNRKAEKLQAAYRTPEIQGLMDQGNQINAQSEQLNQAYQSGGIDEATYNQQFGLLQDQAQQLESQLQPLQDAKDKLISQMDANILEAETFISRYPKEAARRLKDQMLSVRNDVIYESGLPMMKLAANTSFQVGHAMTDFAAKIISIPQVMNWKIGDNIEDRIADIAMNWAESVNKEYMPTPSKFDESLIGRGEEGQLTFNSQVLLPKVVRTLADMAIMVAPALSGAGLTGTVAASYTLTAKDFYDEGLNAGLNQLQASQFANVLGLTTGLLELVNPEAKLLQSSIKKIAAEKAAKMLSEGMSMRDVVRESSMLMFRNIRGENIQEFLQGTADKVGKYAANQLVSADFDLGDMEAEAYETLVLTTIVSGLAGGGIGGLKSRRSELEKQALYGATEDPQMVTEAVNKAVQLGLMTPENAQTISTQVVTLKENLDLLPENVPESERVELVNGLYDKTKLTAAIQNENIDSGVKKLYEDRIKKIDAAVSKIVSKYVDETSVPKSNEEQLKTQQDALSIEETENLDARQQAETGQEVGEEIPEGQPQETAQVQGEEAGELIEKEIDPKDRPTLRVGDMEGMDDGSKRFRTMPLPTGETIVFKKNEDNEIFAVDLATKDVVGFATKLSDTETDLSVAVEFQQKGIGTALLTEFYNLNPDFPIGGLTPLGKKTVDAVKRNTEAAAVTSAETVTPKEDEKGNEKDNKGNRLEQAGSSDRVVGVSFSTLLPDVLEDKRKPSREVPLNITPTPVSEDVEGKTGETISTKYVEKPVDEIEIDEKRFQNRTELDQEQLNQIKDNWNENELDPVVIWRDKNGQSFLLAGHHRLKAAKQLGKKSIDARYFNGTQAEAIQYATEKSNANRTMESPLDRAKKLRQLRESGAMQKQQQEFLKGDGKNKRYVENISYLNPNGKLSNMLRSLAKAGDKETIRLTESAADWVGEARKFYSEFTNEHENELYDYLINKGNLKKIGNKTDFTTRLQKFADVARFNPDQPLNIENRGVKGTLEQAKDLEINEVKSEIKALEKERDKSTPTSQRLTQITSEIATLNNKLGLLNKELREAQEGDKAQIGLFDTALNEINEVINQKLIEDEKANQFINRKNTPDEPAVENIEGTADGSNEAELNEAIREADELIDQPVPVAADEKQADVFDKNQVVTITHAGQSVTGVVIEADGDRVVVLDKDGIVYPVTKDKILSSVTDKKQSDAILNTPAAQKALDKRDLKKASEKVKKTWNKLWDANIGIIYDPVAEAQKTYDFIVALRDLASIAISQGIKNAASFARSIGRKLDPALQTAWDDANRILKGKKPLINTAQDARLLLQKWNNIEETNQERAKARRQNIRSKFIEKILDSKETLMRELEKLSDGIGDIVSHYVNVIGGTAADAKYIAEMFSETIFGGLGKKPIYEVMGQNFSARQLFDRVLLMRRIISIDQKMQDKFDEFMELESQLKTEQAKPESNQQVIDDLKTKRDFVKEYLQRNDVLKKDPTTNEYYLGQFRHIAGLNSEAAQLRLNQIELAHPALYKELTARSEGYHEAFNTINQMLVDAGIISKESADEMAKYDYVPMRNIAHLIEDVIAPGGKFNKKNSDMIKRLQGGSEENVSMAFDDLLKFQVFMAKRKIAINRAGQRLSQMVNEHPDNGTFYKPTIIGHDKFGNEQYADVPQTDDLIPYYEDGIKKAIATDSRIVRQWLGMNDLPINDTDVFLSKASLVELFRGMTTGFNPAFGIAQLALDMPQAILTNDAYASVLTGITQLSYKNSVLLASASSGKKIASTEYKTLYDEARKYGALTTFSGREIDYFHFEESRKAGLLKRIMHSPAIEKTEKKITAFNAALENVTRLSVYEKKRNDLMSQYAKEFGNPPVGKELEDIKIEAASVARNVLNYNRGGVWIKKMNRTVAYLNVGFQVPLSILKYAKKHPLQFAMKAVELSAYPVSLMITSFMMAGSDDDRERLFEYYNNLNEFERQNYWHFYKPWVDTSDKQNVFFRLKKPSILMPLTNKVEYLALDVYSKGKVKSNNLLKDLYESVISPFKTLITGIPLFNMFVNYIFNYDLYRNQVIVRNEEKIPDYLEGIDDPLVGTFYKYTGKKIEEITGFKNAFSPKRAQAAVNSALGNVDRNPLTNVPLQALGYTIAAMDEDWKNMRDAIPPSVERSTVENIIGTLTDPLVNRFKTYVPEIDAEIYEKLDKEAQLKYEINLDAQQVIETVIESGDKVIYKNIEKELQIRYPQSEPDEITGMVESAHNTVLKKNFLKGKPEWMKKFSAMANMDVKEAYFKSGTSGLPDWEKQAILDTLYDNKMVSNKLYDKLKTK